MKTNNGNTNSDQVTPKQVTTETEEKPKASYLKESESEDFEQRLTRIVLAIRDFLEDLNQNVALHARWIRESHESSSGDRELDERFSDDEFFRDRGYAIARMECELKSHKLVRIKNPDKDPRFPDFYYCERCQMRCLVH